MTDVLVINKLGVTYPSSTRNAKVVNDVSLRVKPGQVVGIVGESGSGKSQTMLSVMGLNGDQAKITGSIDLQGTRISELPEREMQRIRGNRVSMIFQDPMTCLTPHLKIKNQLMESIRKHSKVSRSEAYKSAVKMLQSLRLPNAEDRMHQYPHELSGGMRQRIMIAMAILCDPVLLIADEPTTALDVTVQAEILSLLNEIRHERGLSIVLVSHSFGVIASICDRVLVMYKGEIVEAGPIRRVFERPEHPYTKNLLNAVTALEGSAFGDSGLGSESNEPLCCSH